MYACGSPISYTSCSVTDGTETRPPVFGMLRDDERAVGRSPRRSDSRRSRGRECCCQSYRQLPPEHCAPHSMMWPAMMPAASRSQSSAAQPNSWRSGAIVSAVSVDRPVMTMFAPLRQRLDDRHRSDVRVGREHAVAHGRQRLAGLHVRERVAARRSARRDAGGDRRPSRRRCAPRRHAVLHARPAAPPRRTPRGFTPPALAMTRTPRSATAGSTLSIAPTKSRA